MAKSGGRIAKKVTKEELAKAIQKAIISDDEYDDGYDDYKLVQKIEKDVSKINFDFENFYFMKEEEYTDSDFSSEKEEISEYENLENYDIYTLENGLTYCLCCAGGDWEEPVYFIVYIDNKNKLRAYVPSKGNTYNLKYKCAYGSEENCENYEEDENCDETEKEYPQLNIEEFNKDITDRISVI